MRKLFATALVTMSLLGAGCHTCDVCDDCGDSVPPPEVVGGKKKGCSTCGKQVVQPMHAELVPTPAK